MCGRFASDLPVDRLRSLFSATGPLPNDAPNWNVAPSQSVAVVRRHPETGERRIDLLRWGLIPHWSRDKSRQPINARAETVRTSGMFRGAFASRRCIVPASHFYEWAQKTKPKQPYAFSRTDSTPVMLAGLWESWQDPAGELVRTFAIITTQANATLAPIHDRMPVVLERDDWPAWLDEGGEGLLRPAGDQVLRRWMVSTRVNAVRNNDAGLADPIDRPARTEPPDGEAGPDSA